MTEITPITLPKWGLEMSEGTVTGWHLAEGDAAEKGAELVDVETDKIVNVVELDQGGTLRRILVAEGDTVPVGTLIAVMADASVDDAAIDAFIADFKPVDASFDPSEEGGEEAPKPAPAAESAKDVKATPLAKRAAQSGGVDLGSVEGTGRGGKVTKDDVARASGGAPKRSAEEIRAENAGVLASPVARKFANEVGIALKGLTGTGRKGRVSLEDAQEAALAAGLWTRPAPVARGGAVAAASGPANAGAEQPFTGMRKSIVKALTTSKQTVPHFYTTVDIEIDALMDLRRGMNGSADEGDPKVSVNDLLIKACGLALAKHPDVNVHVTETGITPYDQADIAMAVAIDAGLITPVVRNVAGRGLRDIAADAKDLATRARDRSLTAEDLSGGTFTLSNLGMFGVRNFDAIINPPQAAILAVGGPRREAREIDGGVGFVTVMSATLSSDHRAVDGALSARFLSTLKGLVEAPLKLVS
ncbi:dihydrolipoamide acetyltransferase family protein [Maritimibacter sp. UBA3975]|uniref:dihydrolipoamide acetyltransferase family protein n=1 Tax=Maritimibacter sp. UBA3975 TaxID=1946833 RepID=UPI000C0B60F1|nr:dihydrolipoamide acetyltransferase family protein [Maritimibacter sp. UBA3975]MAM61324.1 dehydrogenase [Maritimibacter sp.]|tara:strand:- start:13471 stop:14892 length:1422 start_codon:yes stop_codon:yes gene_type:complete